MPMLADIDDPPRSRWRDLLIGVALALPVVALLVGWFVPVLLQAVLGGAAGLDRRMQAQGEYMQRICSVAMSLPRDEALCECVLAVEHPGLDCQDPFRRWAVKRATAQCADDMFREQAVSYCACIDTVAEDLQTAEDEAGRRKIAQGYDRCWALPDVRPLPTADALAPAP